ncbi:MAG: bifunctional diaminohydroxyphosphoribosylaminopyrimidine deaminase/5-amino-6-(5-phosphoribosylamino)uracil reductase RibD [Pseudomonadota bacterium]|nr:bifunctional diaminohydroxyphosphoribosylaminopyrimidine deaminase/5-amino-6-(5-phosphoribosylamino)uracil reductase RibD [Pseudomonadota bacterium]
MTATEAMHLAILEAQKGWGYVLPNPLVGCVILDRHYNLISQGYHNRYGADHAEINAIRKLKNKDLLDGAHLYVTLEPCAHTGKTPPCAQTLSVLPLASVTYGLTDPNPLVAGRGGKILRAAGIRSLEYNGDPSELWELIEVHAHNLKNKMPFVNLKVGTSLDGQIGLKNGESQWITGKIAREEAHYWRAGCSAVLIGRGTFESDNPSLDVRHPDFLNHKNKVIILDPSGKSLKKINRSKIYATHKSEDIFVVVAPKIKTDRSEVNVITAKYNKNMGFDIKSLLKEFYSLGIFSILVEGGGETLGSFLKQNCGQRMTVFQAPTILGAGDGVAWSSGLKISNLKNRINLSNVRLKKLGNDIQITGRLPEKAQKKGPEKAQKKDRK